MSHFRTAAIDNETTVNLNFKKPLQLRRDSEDVSFDWTQDAGPLPPPSALFRQAQAFPHHRATDEGKRPAPATESPDQAANEAVKNARPVLHAGLLPEDQDEVKLLR
jgi:hypothetical protein